MNVAKQLFLPYQIDIEDSMEKIFISDGFYKRFKQIKRGIWTYHNELGEYLIVAGMIKFRENDRISWLKSPVIKHYYNFFRAKCFLYEHPDLIKLKARKYGKN